MRKSNSEVMIRKHRERLEALLREPLPDWLYQKYIVESRSIRQISEILYGTSENFRSVKRWLERFNIPIRHGSEAVKAQWVDNDSRRLAASEMAKRNLLSDESIAKVRVTQSTPEYHKRASEAKRGEKNPMYGKYGKLNPKFDSTISEEERCTKRKTVDDKLFRIGVFERDGYTCQKCGDSTGGNLNAHHILNHKDNPNVRYSIDNGITLCEKCHREFHKTYGWRHTTWEQLVEFME